MSAPPILAPLILTTGFEPFPSAPLNPTAWLMNRLGEEGWTPEGARLALRTLPTTYDVCEAALLPLVEGLKPAAIVQFGLSARATGVTLERTALNMQTTARPDAAGGFAATPWIDPLGPATRASGLPLAAIAAALAAEGLAHDWSDSAGDYMCNLVFYRCRIARPDAPTGFIHLPYTIPMQAEAIAAGAPQPAGVPMSESDMLAAAKIVLQTVANALRA